MATRITARLINLGTDTLSTSKTTFGAGDLVNKTFVEDYVSQHVDTIVAGFDFQADVWDIQPAAPVETDGVRYIITDTGTMNAAFSSLSGTIVNNDIVQYDATNGWEIVYSPATAGEGALVWVKEFDSFYKYGVSSWEAFGGLSGVTAGDGLEKDGNTILISDGGVTFEKLDPSDIETDLSVTHAVDTLATSTSVVNYTDGKFISDPASATDTNTFSANYLDNLLSKLVPPAPPLLASSSFSTSPVTHTAKRIVSGASVTNIILENAPTWTIDNVYDGVTGTLTVEKYKAGASVGVTSTIDVSASTGELSNIDLTAFARQDYYAGQAGKEDFYYVRDVSITPSSALSFTQNSDSQNKYKYNLAITGPGASSKMTNEVELDVPPTSPRLVDDGSTGFGTVATEASATRWVSGVPTFAAGETIPFNAKLENVVSNFYNSTRVLALTGTGINNQTSIQVESPPATFNEDVTFTNRSLVVSSGVYTTDLEVTATAYNAYNTSGSLAKTHTSPIYIDTVSDESSRLSSGDSASYPTVASMTGFDKKAALTDAGYELQVKNGLVQKPAGNYTTNQMAGPDYSGFSTKVRFYTVMFNITGTTGGVNITFNNPTGFGADTSFYAEDPGLTLEVKYVNGADTTYWINGSAAYSNNENNYRVTAGEVFDGVAGLVVSASTGHTKQVTWNDATMTGGEVYIRVGFQDDRSFSSITVTNM